MSLVARDQTVCLPAPRAPHDPHGLQDFRGDVTALVKDLKVGVVERTRYGMTGRPESFPPADVNFDGKVDDDDKDSFQSALKEFGNSAANYDPRADLDHNGTVDGDDENLFNQSYTDTEGLTGLWKLSTGDGLVGVGKQASGLDNRFGWRRVLGSAAHEHRKW